MNKSDKTNPLELIVKDIFDPYHIWSAKELMERRMYLIKDIELIDQHLIKMSIKINEGVGCIKKKLPPLFPEDRIENF